MAYFCYISRNKIDSLFESHKESSVISETKTRTVENNSEAEIDASLGINKVINLLSAKVSFGRKGIVQYQQELKKTYTEKLSIVLRDIKGEVKKLTEELLNRNSLRGIYYSYAGEFTIHKAQPHAIKQEFVTIESKFYLNEVEYTLLLDCSVKNFSEVLPNGEYHLHSSNYGFFQRKLSIKFDALIMKLSFKDRIVNGTPLYLLLDNDGIGL